MAQTKKPQAKTPVEKTAQAKKEPVITLTKEQYAELKSIVWDNKIEELEDLGVGGEDDMKVIGFMLGQIYSSLKSQFEKIEEILDEIEPNGYTELFDDSEDDEDGNY